jgi:hypothetical protein
LLVSTSKAFGMPRESCFAELFDEVSLAANAPGAVVMSDHSTYNLTPSPLANATGCRASTSERSLRFANTHIIEHTVEDISKSSSASNAALRNRQRQYQGHSIERGTFNPKLAQREAQLLYKEVYQTTVNILPVRNFSSQYKGPKKYIADTGAPIDAVGRTNLPAKDLKD